MGASYFTGKGRPTGARIYDILYNSSSTLPQSIQAAPVLGANVPVPSILELDEPDNRNLPNGLALQLVQDRADIDISGPEFNFVRSIRVFDVRYARQHESGRDGDCNRYATVVLGTYGTQGDFSWSRSSIGALPEAHVGLERWGDTCPSIYHRSVFVDWRDYEGSYGFEQVNY